MGGGGGIVTQDKCEQQLQREDKIRPEAIVLEQTLRGFSFGRDAVGP